MNSHTTGAGAVWSPGADVRGLRSVLGRFPTGVTIVTTRAADARPVGVTVNSFNSVSLDPPLVLWSLATRSVSLPVFKSSGRFAINMLADDQHEIAKRFATPVEDKFRDLEIDAGVDGLPLISGAIAHLECRTEKLIHAGDHVILLGRVDRAAQFDGTPLVYHGGRFETLEG